MKNALKSLFYIIILKIRFYNWSKQRIKRHQEKRLNKLIALLKRKSIYYRDILKDNDNFEKLPVIDKKVFMDNFDNINTAGLKKDILLDFSIKQQRSNSIGLFNENYSIGLSSGTSGNVTLTVLSKSERELYPTLLLARSNIISYVKKPRVLFLLRRNNAAFMEVKKFGIYISYADYTVNVDKLIYEINDKKINVIAGPPSLLYMISKKIDEIVVKPKLLISYAEVLSEKVKNTLVDSFGSKLIEIYQGAEGFLAATCKEGSLHLNEDTTFFEFENIDKENENLKRVLVTDLYRTCAPFVRYSLHDVMELDDKKCKCGSNFQIIKKIHGREDDIFILKSNDGKERYLFPDYVRRSINQASEYILEFQAIQHINGSITIRLVTVNNQVSRDIENKIIENINFWVNKIKAITPEINYIYEGPIRNKNSNKLIRVMRENENN
ncbi:MAG: F390 synthetase-related protein [Candidatus Kerfeldbacteria bacterium]